MIVAGSLLGLGLLCAVYYVVNRDITERELAEQALRVSEERFRVFMDNSPAVAFMKDEDGRFVFMNQAIEHRFPMKRHEWLGKTDFDLWPAETAERLR